MNALKLINPSLQTHKKKKEKEKEKSLFKCEILFELTT
jgi:hypothetical protein